jgi:hypothetical protein
MHPGSASCERREHHLVPPPEPLEKAARHVEPRSFRDFSDGAGFVDGVEETLLLRVDRQEEILERMRAIDQDARGPTYVCSLLISFCIPRRLAFCTA